MNYEKPQVKFKNEQLINIEEKNINIWLDLLRYSKHSQFEILPIISTLAAMLLVVATFNEKIFEITYAIRFCLAILLWLIPSSIISHSLYLKGGEKLAIKKLLEKAKKYEEGNQIENRLNKHIQEEPLRRTMCLSMPAILFILTFIIIFLIVLVLQPIISTPWLVTFLICEYLGFGLILIGLMLYGSSFFRINIITLMKVVISK